MENVSLIFNKRKVLASLDNNLPLAMFRILILIRDGGNNDAIFLRKLYCIYQPSFESHAIEQKDVLVSLPFDIDKNLRKVLIVLSKGELIGFEKKASQLKIFLTEKGKVILRDANDDKELSKLYVRITHAISKITDSDLDKQQLMW